MMYTRSKTLIVAALTLVVLGIIFYAINTYQKKNRSNGSINSPQASPEPTAVVPQDATFEGTYVCLPHKNTSGPQTEECAFGIHLDDGTYYALSMSDLLGSSVTIKFSTGTRIRAQGTVVPIEMISSGQWQKYPVKGIMQVKDITQL